MDIFHGLRATDAINVLNVLKSGPFVCLLFSFHFAGFRSFCPALVTELNADLSGMLLDAVMFCFRGQWTMHCYFCIFAIFRSIMFLDQDGVQKP